MTDNAKKDALKSLRAEMRQIDLKIEALQRERKALHDECCVLEWGFNIGDTIRHKAKGTVGVVFDFETYWPRIKKVKKNGAQAQYTTNAYYPEQWEKV